MFYTDSGREISYYGAELGEKIRRQHPDASKAIQTLNDLFALLLKAWRRETAYPSSQKDPLFNLANDPTYGQCAITATLVHDLFGGSIHKIRVEGGGTHYFNKIDGQYIDLTSDQFSLYDIPLDYEPNMVIDRRYCNKNKNTHKRYLLLAKNISELIAGEEDDDGADEADDESLNGAEEA